jgi:subtilase family serine protease
VFGGVPVLRGSSRLAVVVGALALLVLPGAAQGANGHASYRAVCPNPPAGYGHCHELVVTDSHGNPLASTAPSGLDPATIRSVYGFPTGATAGAGQTIAIVDAYDDPTAENDLNVFSGQYGLSACTTANGCFTKVNQTGGTSYPRANSGWALEISLDVQWAHAIAPGAKILLVEASSNSFSNLLAAEDYARQHAQYVSNSWGGSESSGEASYDSHFLAPSGKTVSFFVSAGDSGLPAEYPSASPNVISVGGTTLTFNSDGSLKSETGWSSGGGGCSAYEAATGAQTGFSGYGQVSCGGKRATPDVSLDADPNSGVSVYDSTSYYGQGGWWTVGGTSASSPMWAAAAADAGALVNSAFVYGNTISFRDITQGNNGAPCLTGYDLCSGRGSWLYATSSPPPSQTSLSFTSGTQTLTAGQPSSAVQVSLSSTQANDVTVTLSSSSQQGQFATSTNGSWSSSLHLTITAGQTTSPSFYYQDTTAGSPTLTASASGITSAGQTETVQAATLATIAVSPNPATVTVGGSQTFTATGADQYGNTVDVSNAAWTTDAPGTVSPASGSSTVFTAGSTTGSGSVTATVGSTAGSASVTVTGLVAPSNLTASAQGKHIGLTWQSSDTGVTYNLYRGTAAGAETLYATGLTSTSANDMSVASGTTYYYYVTAVGQGGIESSPSNEASAKAR